MPIVQFPSNVLVLKQPKIASYSATSSNGIYYTVLSTTGRGKISKIILTYSASGVVISNNFLNIKVTIDGIVNTINGGSYASGLQHTADSTINGYDAVDSIDYHCDLTFLNYATIEVMHNSSSGTIYLVSAVMYSTE